jgi:hypothetical protein
VDELDLDGFRYGGVNITGFRLVDREDPAVRAIFEEWVKLYPDPSRLETGKLTVIYVDMFFHPTCTI